MSLGLYWRLALLIPPMAFLVLTVALGINVGLDDPQRSTWQAAGAFMLFVVGTTIATGVWPAYAVWAALYLWLTRRWPGARLRARAWLAPLTFAPLCAAAWYAAVVLPKPDAAPVRIEGLAAVIGSALLLGYISVALAFALEWLLGLRLAASRPHDARD